MTLTITLPADATREDKQRAFTNAVMATLSEGVCYRCDRRLDEFTWANPEPDGVGRIWTYSSVCWPCGWHYYVGPDGFAEHINEAKLEELRSRDRWF